MTSELFIKMHRAAKTVFAVAFASLVVAGCGGGGSDAQVTQSQTQTQNNAPTATGDGAATAQVPIGTPLDASTRPNAKLDCAP
jgi:hypothetical protein